MPAVIVKSHRPVSEPASIIEDVVCHTQTLLKDSRIEGLQVDLKDSADLESFKGLHEALHSVVSAFFLNLHDDIDLSDLQAFEIWPAKGSFGTTWFYFEAEDAHYAVASALAGVDSILAIRCFKPKPAQ